MASLRTCLLVSSLLAPLALAQSAAQQPPASAALSDEMAARIAEEGIQRSKVHAILAEMTGDIGHRLTGSDNFTKACEWAKGHFEAMGLEVELEEWDEWQTVWTRVGYCWLGSLAR